VDLQEPAGLTAGEHAAAVTILDQPAVRAGTIRCRRPTLTGVPSTSHTGWTTPSQANFAANDAGIAPRPPTHDPSVDRWTYTRYRANRPPDPAEPADPADPAEPAEPTVASDREATSASPSA